ncbi:MAG TPA: hypothetical protein VGQ33_23695 [Vicinamibacteria bacterium]|nr:hypothetical protein [Vicinamibacteria bacterium]
MSLATPNAGRGKTKVTALPSLDHPTSRVEIVENPIALQDPQLAAEIEDAVQRALRDEDLGTVQVRFRVCRDELYGLKFICKVENPPRVDGEGAAPSWRWWSPLLETARDFRESLDEGLKVRRHRLAHDGAGAR